MLSVWAVKQRTNGAVMQMIVLRRTVTIALLLSDVGVVGAQSSRPAERCGLGVPATQTRGYVGLPTGGVFCPLIADPKAVSSFLSYQQTSEPFESTTRIGAVGIGDAFSVFRLGGTAADNGVQLDIEGAIFAQFDLGTSSYDLINADYLVGLPLTFRGGLVSARVRVYHQSSHLGDEFLLRSKRPERENLSFEAAEAILSIDVSALRLYGGGEYLFRRTPQDLQEMVAHAGAELRPGMPLIRFGNRIGVMRFIAAGDFKASEEQDWKPSVSGRAGFELDRPGEPRSRRWSLLFEWYRGPMPYGQFFRNKIEYVGVGAHFAL
jgi:hypothetical protein